jgi:uridine phosphorylase
MSSDANRPRTGDVLYHIHCKAGDLPPFSLLPGDPERVTTISSLWDNAEEVAYHREYRTARGLYQGVPISTTSTGVGSPGLEICLHELREVGVETAIRVGTTGSITEKFDCGDLIISTPASAATEPATRMSSRASPPSPNTRSCWRSSKPASASATATAWA